jgi:hypothetical protein
MDKEHLIRLINDAFQNVVLGDGTSILQTQVISNYGEGYTDHEFDDLKMTENVANWKILTTKELEKLEGVYLDAEGFRYYIPALMVEIINNYRYMSNISNVTVFILDPFNRKTNNANFYAYDRYALLDQPQRNAIIAFLSNISNLVNLGEGDALSIESARVYWELSTQIPAQLPKG